MSMDRIARCDRCDLQGHLFWAAKTTSAARKNAGVNGWRSVRVGVGRGRLIDLCPSCQKQLAIPK